ncbi:hypothetical protein VDGD_21301 [Verticillium dahliae]|nr:hypothetical protein VDGD_21301 [Verticillium dahliae]
MDPEGTTATWTIDQQSVACVRFSGQRSNAHDSICAAGTNNTTSVKASLKARRRASGHCSTTKAEPTQSGSSLRAARVLFLLQPAERPVTTYVRNCRTDPQNDPLHHLTTR